VASAISGLAIDADTVFRLESLTKMVTTTVILQLCDIGVLALDAAALDYVPSGQVDPRLNSATIRHLLSHQSGLPDLTVAAHRSHESHIDAAAASLASAPLLFAPGAALSYSGGAFVLLGAVAEGITGLDWETLVREAVLVPLEMRHTCVTVDEALAHRTAVGHLHSDGSGPAQVVTDPVPRGLAPAAGLLANTADLLQVARLYAGVAGPDGSPVISEQSRLDAVRGERPLASGFAPGLTQGLGWQIARWSGRTVLMHHAFGRGSAGHVAVDLVTGHGFSVLVNSDSGETACTEISRLLLDAVLNVRIPSYPVAPPSLDLSRYVGEYWHDEERRFFVEIDGIRLTLRASAVYRTADVDAPRSPIRPIDRARFAHGGGIVLFGGFDDAGIPHTLHVQNQLAQRVG
jgi:CubicO group peptidase (beta-lactamase class C family)